MSDVAQRSIRNGAPIMIVEDSVTQAMMLRHVLEQNGYEVVSAGSGKEALRIIRDRKPLLVISDIVMPEMDGYELTRRIKNDAVLRDIPVILLTTLSTADDILHGIDAQVDYFLHKPVDGNFLVSRIRSVLSAPIAVNTDGVQTLEVVVNGQSHFVSASAKGSLNLLISTYENAVQINNRLRDTQTELKDLNRDLERKVKERTAHLEAEIAKRQKAEDDVRRRTEELESAYNELKEFAYTVSHDLKAPLRGIAQLAEWIAADHAKDMCDEGRDLLSMLLKRMARMHNLIEGILEYSRLGRVREQQREINLDAEVREVIDILAVPAHIEVVIDSPLPRIKFERTRAGQLFQNLIGNAAKFMDKPIGKINIGYTETDAEWIFYVADNGPGIEEKYHEKIFQIFQTLTARDEFESTGIGLTLVKRIMEKNQGRVWLKSLPGQGTTFFFAVPKNGDRA